MRTKRIGPGTAVALVLLALGGSAPVLAQSSDELSALKQEIEALKQTQGTIQNTLQEIMKLLRAAPPAGARPTPSVKPADVALRLDGAPFRGEKGAALTLIEFSDYQCPFCGRHFREVLPQILKDYIDTGKVKYVMKDFPIEAIHPRALKAAEAARCAGEQGRYWEMHALLFGNQRTLGAKDLAQNAEALGLDMEAFRQCLDGGKYAAEVRTDVEVGKRNGVNATPTFFLGLTDVDGATFKAMRVIVGAQPYTAFKEAIDSLLAAQKRP